MDTHHQFGSGRYMPGSVKVVSVYPVQPTIIKRFYGTDPNPRGPRVTNYILPPCPKGSAPVIVEVFDGFQNVPDPEDPNNVSRARTHIISARDVANDIVHHWTGSIVGTTADSKPGIGIWEQAGEPSQEFIDALYLQQDSYFQALYYEAQRLVAEKKHDQLRKDHREAAQYLGRKVEWAQEMRRDDFKECQFCRTQINGLAVICPNCHQTVDQDRLDEMKEERLDRLTAPTAA